MPTLFEIFGLRFFFYSDEHQPIHIHVEKGGGKARIIVSPEIELDYNKGLHPNDLKKAMKLIELYQQDIIKTWNEYFDE